MADSVVYEYPGFTYTDTTYNCVKLVKYKEQVIFVEIKKNLEKDTYKNQTILVYNVLDKLKTSKNFNTQKVLGEFANTENLKPINESNRPYSFSNLSVFMYSESILWIGCQKCYLSTYHSYYCFWLFDLDQLKLIKFLEVNWIGKIIPVGQKYFKIIPYNPTNQINLYAWSELERLDKPIEPVFQFNTYDNLYSIDWSSSSIKYLESVEFVLVVTSLDQLNFLDKNFNKILTLNLQDLFPELDQNVQSNSPIEPNWEKKYISNANCLLYWKDFDHFSYVYCWDFTNNSQVNFPNGKKFKKQIKDIVPFCSGNKIKILTREANKNGNDKFQIYELE